MKPKEKELLKRLIEQKDQYVTSQQLAFDLSLSDRTIRNYIQQFKNELERNGATIISKPGYGFQLHIHQPIAFNLYLNQNNIVQNQVMVEIEDREHYILNKLLLEEATVFIEALSEELYISKTSLNKDIQSIKQRLTQYGLALENQSKKGIKVVGKEKDKRHFIMDTFFGKSYFNSLQHYVGPHQFFDQLSVEAITLIIIEEIRKAKIKLSDFIIQNLVLHLSLAVKRIMEGYEITDYGSVSDLSDTYEFQIAEQIVKRIECATTILFPKEEISYLALHLMAKSNQKELPENHQLEKELEHILMAISTETGYQFSKDEQLKTGLMAHLGPMLIRLEKKIVLDNPLTSAIKKDNGTIFELTKRHFSIMPCLKGYLISDEEWAYLVLHIMAAFEKLKKDYRIKALIICATSYGSAQLLQNRIINEFGENIIVTKTQGYYDINEESLKEADIIISSIDLSAMVFRVPVLHVSVFLNDEDVMRIKKAIQQLLPYQLDYGELPELTLSSEPSTLSKYLNPEFFKVFETNSTKEEVVESLLELLCADEEPSYKEKMKQQMKVRENMGQIVFSPNIVVPHPATPIGQIAKIAIGIIPNGLKWDSEHTVQFVFLISPSYIENETITVFTKTIVHLIESEETQMKIIEKPTFEVFKHYFLTL